MAEKRLLSSGRVHRELHVPGIRTVIRARIIVLKLKCVNIIFLIRSGIKHN